MLNNTAGTPSLVRRIFSIAIPVTIQNLVNYVLVFTDTAFIGHYRVDGLSAINNALTSFFTLTSFFFALAQGTTILIAQNLGAGKPEKASEYARVSIIVNQLISFGYFLFWLICSPLVLRIVGAQGEIFDMGVTYLRTLSFIFLWMGLGMSAASIFEGIGWTAPIMIVAVVKSGLNIFLDWGLIFGNLFFPEWGIFGAAFATVVSDLAGTILLLFLLFRNKHIPLSIRGVLSAPLKLYRDVIRLGLPAGTEFILWSGGQTILVMMLNRWDPLASGIYALMATLGQMSVQLYMGFGVAATNLVGKATGAKDAKGALRAGNMTVLYSILACAVIAAIFFAFPRNIVGLFSSDEAFTLKVLPLLAILALASFPRALNIVAGNAIRGTGNTKWMMYTQIGGTVGIIGMAALFLFVFDWGMVGVCLAIGIDEGWRGFLNYGRFVLFDYKRLLKIAAEAKAAENAATATAAAAATIAEPT